MSKNAHTFQAYFDDDDFLADAEVLNAIPQEKLDSIIERVSRCEPSSIAIFKSLRADLSDTSQALSLLKTLLHFSRLFSGQSHEVRLGFVNEVLQLRPSIVSKSERAAQVFDEYVRRLPTLLTPLLSIQIMRKAGDFILGLSNRLTKFSSSVELHPLYTGGEHAGLVPVVSMRLIYQEDDDAPPRTLELRLSVHDIEPIREQLANTKARLSSLETSNGLKLLDINLFGALAEAEAGAEAES